MLNNTMTSKCGLQVDSTSLKPMPLKSLSAVSYWPCTLTMAISVAGSEIFSVKQWCDLEQRFRVNSR